MISIFGVNSKEYSDFPLTYQPATGFKWRIISVYVESSASSMTVFLYVVRNNTEVATILSTSTYGYFDAWATTKTLYTSMELSSLDGLSIGQSGGASGNYVTAVITVEVLPA